MGRNRLGPGRPARHRDFTGRLPPVDATLRTCGRSHADRPGKTRPIADLGSYWLGQAHRAWPRPTQRPPHLTPPAGPRQARARHRGRSCGVPAIGSSMARSSALSVIFSLFGVSFSAAAAPGRRTAPAQVIRRAWRKRAYRLRRSLISCSSLRPVTSCAGSPSEECATAR